MVRGRPEQYQVWDRVRFRISVTYWLSRNVLQMSMLHRISTSGRKCASRILCIQVRLELDIQYPDCQLLKANRLTIHVVLFAVHYQITPYPQSATRSRADAA
jgi:hypothetical protein